MTADTAQIQSEYTDGVVVEPRPRIRGPFKPARYRVMRVDDVKTPYWSERPVLDNPQSCVDFWNNAVVVSQDFDRSVEIAVSVLLDARLRPLGYDIISKGTVDQVLTTPALVFKGAIVAGSKRIVFIHNHPSGDPLPSEADIRCTRELKKAGELLHIELLDSLIVGSSERDGVCRRGPSGNRGYTSLRELGYFAV